MAAGVGSIASIRRTTSWIGRFIICAVLATFRMGNARTHGKACRTRLVKIEARSYAFQKLGSVTAMKQLRIGDITIDAVIEREGPWRRPQDFFPAYDDAVFRHHLAGMEPEVFDTALEMMVITYQTFVVRTPRYIILVDTCTGEDKGIRRRSIFPARSAGATSCSRSVSPMSRSITCS